jgi:outer membrane protein assembly factor BamA
MSYVWHRARLSGLSMKLTQIAVLICLVLLASSVFAAEPARFPVESIDVTGGGARIQSIVVAQSLLREGQTYSEAELADAVSRIRRLPFVRAVSFSLAKGSERGLYRLVINVDPMMSLYFDAQARSRTSDNQTPRTFNYGALTVGGRIPVGSSGMARASVSAAEDFENIFDGDRPRSKPTFALGYSLYRIGSRAIFADVTIFGAQPEPGLLTPQSRIRYGNQWGTQVVVGVPLRGSQSVRAEWNGFHTPVTLEAPSGTERGTTRFDSVQLFWLRDTTDDPLYPLHGSLIKAGLVGGRGRSLGFSTFPQPALAAQRYDYRGGEVSGSYYWSLANERALSAHGRYGNTRTYFETPFEASYGNSQVSIGAGFTQRLSGPNTDAWIDFRLDGTRFGDSSFNNQLEARVELAHRSKWGVARIGASYFGQRN